MGMNYGELKALVADYLHRADLTDQIPGFITIAAARLNRDLRIREMIQYATITPTENPFDLPTDYLELRELSRGSTNTTGRTQLTRINRHQLNAYTSASGSPLFYSIDGLKAQTVPGGVDTEFEIIYYAKMSDLVNDSDTNAVLSRYPNLYLYGALIEAYSWIQDQANQSRVTDMFTSEIDAANVASNWAESGESPQAQGASLWG